MKAKEVREMTEQELEKKAKDSEKGRNGSGV
jgi:ribosomal protein L29